jgi:hypothetical protein
VNNGFDGFVLEGGPSGNSSPQVHYTERWRVPIDITGGGRGKARPDGLKGQ